MTSAVSAPLPRAMLPAPEIAPAVCAKLLRLKVAPLATKISDAEDMRLAAPSVSVPALMDVDPVYVLTPDSVIAPVPILVNPPVPLITPVNVVAALLPPPVSDPIASENPFSARETPAAFAKEIAAVSAIALPPIRLRVPPLMVVVP